MTYYRVDYRDQDSGWEIDMYAQRQRLFSTLSSAIRYAEEASRDWLYGMARVVDVARNVVMCEFGCGHAPYSEESLRSLWAWDTRARQNYEEDLVDQFRLEHGLHPTVNILNEMPPTPAPVARQPEQFHYVEADTDVQPVSTDATNRNRRLVRVREQPGS
jgi:hypothetical protein